MLKAVAFDLGGVLFLDGKAVAIPKMARDFGLEAESLHRVLTSELSNKVRRGQATEGEFWEWARKELKLGDDFDMKKLRDAWYEGYVLDESVRDVVIKLRRCGVRTLAFTGNIPSRIDFLESRFGFRSWFDECVLSYDHHGSKTQPEFHRAMLLKAHCEPPEVLLVDDEEKHTRVAESLGIRCFLFRSGETNSLIAKLRQLGVSI